MSEKPRQMAPAHHVDPYDFEERAAILEYDAADVYPTRQAAERRAAQLIAKLQRTTGSNAV
jgi:hypothetical protein